MLTPLGNTYALALTAAAQNLVTAVTGGQMTTEICDYMVTVDGASHAFINWDGTAAVFPTTGNNKPGVLIAGNSIQVISAPKNTTFSIISNGTASTVYITPIAQ